MGALQVDEDFRSPGVSGSVSGVGLQQTLISPASVEDSRSTGKFALPATPSSVSHIAVSSVQS